MITVFDLGACHGEMAIHDRTCLPASTVLCFEPFAERLAVLEANPNGNDAIRIFSISLADHDSESRFFSRTSAPTNSSLAAESTIDDVRGKGVVQSKDEVVGRLTTLDQFVEYHSINNIDILTLDVLCAEHPVLTVFCITAKNREFPAR